MILKEITQVKKMKFVATTLVVLLSLLFIITTFSQSSSSELQIPSWIKNTASMWSDQKIAESKFIQSLQYLVKTDVLQIPLTESDLLPNTYILPKYGQTSLITISGTTGELKKRNNAALTIMRPDGQTIELTVPVLESGVYHASMILKHDWPIGAYKVSGTFSGATIPVSYFYVKDNTPPKVPLWIKNNARWWANGMISDNDFVSGIQYLINKKIIEIDSSFERPQHLQTLYIDVQGQAQVRRGTMQSITVHVTDGNNSIDGATVIVRVEDYGENEIIDFEGNTDSDGNYSFSWEIDKNAKAETLLVFVDATNGFSSASSIFSFEVWCHCGEQDCDSPSC